MASNQLSECVNCTHPLTHNGTHQKDRLASALLPENLKLDNRGTTEFLGFAHEYAALIKYFDTNNIENDNWQCFFSGGILGVLSIISAIDLAAIDDKYCRAELDFWESLEKAEETVKEAVRQEKYQVLLNCIFELAQKINKICQDLPHQFGLKGEVLAYIKKDIGKAIFQNKFQNSLKILIAYEKGNQQIDENGKLPALEQKYKAFIVSNNNNSSCTKAWEIGTIDDFFCITPDDGFKEQQAPELCKENQILRSVFFTFFQVLSKIVKRTKFYLEKELNESNAQEPQVSLFLSFIFLFRRLLQQYNQLTERHLDFFYEQVLCLPYHPFKPDQVFVFFELAKNFNEFQLTKGTLLDAKKDEEGNKMEYITDDELVVNLAKVEACQALYLNTNQLYTLQSNSQNNGLKDGPIDWRKLSSTNSPKGELGFAFSDPILNMKEGTRFITIKIPLANPEVPYTKTEGDDISNHLTVNASSNLGENGWISIPQSNVNSNLKDELIVPTKEKEKGLNDNKDNFNKITKQASYFARLILDKAIEIRILLKDDNFPIDIPQIDNPLFKNLKAPILKVNFGQELQKFLTLKNVTSYKVTIDVHNIKSGVSTRNQYGTYNNKDTFPLLGIVYPKGNDVQSLIGQNTFIEFEVEELKGKQLLGLNPQPNYTTIKPTGDNFTTDTRFSPTFKIIDTISEYLIPVGAVNPEPTFGGPQLPGFATFPVETGQIRELPPTRDEVLDFNDTNLNSTPNDSRLSQSATNLNIGYPELFNTSKILTTYYQNQYKYRNDLNIPIPQIGGLQNLSVRKNLTRNLTSSDISCITYSALRNQNILSLTYNVEDNKADDFKTKTIYAKGVNFRYAAFANFIEKEDGKIYHKKEFERYHITPQGYNLINPTNPDQPITLLPNEYLFPNPSEANISVAHLEIGIRDLIPGQLLSLLFQMEQGSGNTNCDPPEVQWSFLAKDNDNISDEWMVFEAGTIFKDSTKTDQSSKQSLLQTGIINFVTNPRMTNQGTSIKPDAGLYWIRATFIERNEQSIAALPNIMSIHTNATTATFNNRNNTLTHLETSLPIETISKLSNQVAAIKTTTQPLASFNGRIGEDRNAYYRRVSERLRHKNRAINIWDYERLILEAFPEVAHAKVITHASKNCSIAPGKVLIVVFPDLRNRNDIHPFTPGFNIGKLEEIEDFIRAKTNLFLNCGENIQVINPNYELIQVLCCVRFHQGFSPPFYVGQLNNELHTFLAPWVSDNQTDLHFSGQLNTSTILNFIEERPYVDVISDFEINHFYLDKNTQQPKPINDTNGDGTPVPITADLIKSQSNQSLFTTFPQGHMIKLWGSTECNDCKATDFTTFQLCID